MDRASTATRPHRRFGYGKPTIRISGGRERSAHDHFEHSGEFVSQLAGDCG
jgi:hypothetical protein